MFPGYSSRCLGCHEFTLQLPQGPSMQSKIRCAVRVQPMRPWDFEINFQVSGVSV